MAHRIRKGDLVQVMTGDEEDRRQGRVMAIDHDTGRVRVEKVRMQKRHLKPGRSAARTGGIIEQEGYVDLSNVMLVDPSTHQPSRVRIQVDGDKRTRVFVKSGEDVPEPTQT